MRGARWHTALGLVVVGWGCCLLHCNGEKAAAGGASSRTVSATSTPAGTVAAGWSGPSRPDASVQPRLATRRYYLANVADKCIVYWEEGDQRSSSQQSHCPRDLEPGERIRLAGRTCFREGGESARHAPVHCPRQILAAEKAGRIDAGLEPPDE